MKKMVKWFCVLSAVAAFLIGIRWSLMPVLAPPQGLYSGTEVDLIHARYPHSLIDPAKVAAGQSGDTFGWVMAEMKARGIVLLEVTGVFLGGVLAFRMVRRRKIAANNAPQDMLASSRP